MAHDHLIAQLDQLQQQFGESHALLLADGAFWYANRCAFPRGEFD